MADYMQNLDMPHFGGEQPGDTYYYSPLTVNGFGVVDYCVELLDAYIYTEAEGKKGGNNVVYLLHKSLKKKGVLQKLQIKDLENSVLWYSTTAVDKIKIAWN